MSSSEFVLCCVIKDIAISWHNSIAPIVLVKGFTYCHIIISNIWFKYGGVTQAIFGSSLWKMGLAGEEIIGTSSKTNMKNNFSVCEQ